MTNENNPFKEYNDVKTELLKALATYGIIDLSGVIKPR
jgi:hypothetical protein